MEARLGEGGAAEGGNAKEGRSRCRGCTTRCFFSSACGAGQQRCYPRRKLPSKSYSRRGGRRSGWEDPSFAPPSPQTTPRRSQFAGNRAFKELPLVTQERLTEKCDEIVQGQFKLCAGSMEQGEMDPHLRVDDRNKVSICKGTFNGDVEMTVACEWDYLVVKTKTTFAKELFWMHPLLANQKQPLAQRGGPREILFVFEPNRQESEPRKAPPKKRPLVVNLTLKSDTHVDDALRRLEGCVTRALKQVRERLPGPASESAE